jgi:quercetin dioxygenase-like cupin family protein
MSTTLPYDVTAKELPVMPPGMKDDGKRKIWTPAANDWALFERYGRETDGEYTLLHVSLAPGCKNEEHFHGLQNETFTSVQGNVGVYSKSTGKVFLEPGQSVTVHAGETHYFFNPHKETVEMKIKLHPSREGMEKGLYTLYGLARDGKCHEGGVPHSLMHSAIIFSMSDMWPSGLNGFFTRPLLKLLALVGKINGTEAELVRKYWA